MRFRHQVMRNLHHECLGEFLELQRQKNKLLDDAGLATYSVWSPAFGGLFHLVLEAEFDSMAAVQEHQAAAKTLTGYAEANSAQMKLVIEGTAADRLIKLSLAG